MISNFFVLSLFLAIKFFYHLCDVSLVLLADAGRVEGTKRSCGKNLFDSGAKPTRAAEQSGAGRPAV